MRVWLQLPLSLSCQQMTVACICSPPKAPTIRVKTGMWQNQLPALRRGVCGDWTSQRENRRFRRTEHINPNLQSSRALLLKEKELAPNDLPQLVTLPHPNKCIHLQVSPCSIKIHLSSLGMFSAYRNGSSSLPAVLWSLRQEPEF